MTRELSVRAAYAWVAGSVVASVLWTGALAGVGFCILLAVTR